MLEEADDFLRVPAYFENPVLLDQFQMLIDMGSNSAQSVHCWFYSMVSKLRITGIHIVSRASMPHDKLALAKFYLLIQQGRIVPKQHVNGQFTLLLQFVFSCDLAHRTLCPQQRTLMLWSQQTQMIQAQMKTKVSLIAMYVEKNAFALLARNNLDLFF